MPLCLFSHLQEKDYSLHVLQWAILCARHWPGHKGTLANNTSPIFLPLATSTVASHSSQIKASLSWLIRLCVPGHCLICFLTLFPFGSPFCMCVPHSFLLNSQVSVLTQGICASSVFCSLRSLLPSFIQMLC